MKPSQNNGFSPYFDCLKGQERERSYLTKNLAPAKTGRTDLSVKERTKQTLAFFNPRSQIVIGQQADSDKRASFSKARI